MVGSFQFSQAGEVNICVADCLKYIVPGSELAITRSKAIVDVVHKVTNGLIVTDEAIGQRILLEKERSWRVANEVMSMSMLSTLDSIRADGRAAFSFPIAVGCLEWAPTYTHRANANIIGRYR